MSYALWALGGLIVGGLLAWLLALNRVRSQYQLRLDETERRANTAEGRAAAHEGTISELRSQNQKAAEDFDKLRSKVEAEYGAKVKAETQLTETLQRLEEEKKLLEDARNRLTDTFKAIAGDTLDNSTAAFLKLAKETFEKVLVEAKGDLGKRQEAIQGLVKPIAESLRQFDEHVRDIESSRQEAYVG